VDVQIAVEPKPLSVERWGDARLAARAGGDEPLTYAWYHNHHALAGQTAASLTLRRVEANQAGDYTVQVRNPWGEATSGPVTLKVIGIVVDDRDLVDMDLSVQDLADIENKTIGDRPMSYQWYRQGEPIPESMRAVQAIDTRAPGLFVYRVKVKDAANLAQLSKDVRVRVSPLKAERISDLGLDLVPVPAGVFLQGQGEETERQRNIQISRGFLMATTEVTRSQWAKVFPADGEAAIEQANLPQTASFEKAVQFCKELTRRERAAGRLAPGWEYTLPHEAEWEHAARLGGAGANLAEEAWILEPGRGENALALKPVGLKRRDQLGLFDILGNAWEWTADFYAPYDPSVAADPTGPPVGEYRVLRGASVSMGAAGVRPTRRYKDRPDEQREDYGFRIIKRHLDPSHRSFQPDRVGNAAVPKEAPR
jgi:formylglycine-generating enzyme required for sulfatase activity